MILADTLAARVRKMDFPEAADLLAQLEAAPKFVFDAFASKAASDALARPAEVAALIPLPSEIGWIEIEDGLRGLLFKADGPTLRSARCIIAIRHKAEVKLSTDILRLDAGGLQAAPASINSGFLGAIALLATPALCDKRESNLARLNRSREKSGKPKLYEHVLIRLDLAQPTQPGGPRPNGDSKGARKHHFCRAFLRFRLGQMELVRPHWRGDSTLGVTRPHFRVTA